VLSAAPAPQVVQAAKHAAMCMGNFMFVAPFWGAKAVRSEHCRQRFIG
jgi:hypothetical protein